MTTGDRIRKARLAAGYKTQMALAKAIAVSQPTISDWESGKMQPTGEHLARLTAGVNCSPGWVLFGDEATSEAAGTREPLKMLKPPKLARAASNAPPTRGRGGDQVPRATVSLAGWPSRGGRSSPPKPKVDPMTSSASNPGRESAG